MRDRPNEEARSFRCGLPGPRPAYFEALRVDFFSPPWLLRLLEALAWLGEDLDSVLAAVLSDLPLERLSVLLDCFVAMWNSLDALGWWSPFLVTGLVQTVRERVHRTPRRPTPPRVGRCRVNGTS
jgi:hypothetical protein